MPHGGGSDVDQARAEGYQGEIPADLSAIRKRHGHVPDGVDRRYRRRGVSEDQFGLIGENAMLSIFTRSTPQPIREPADVMEILKLAA